ncbi:hypothetical protein [Fischerella sp. PCC 9605]|uniref:hypothetical protein n=1 Tax=Fischerella sp. PCC 9605 TaxID=1173024 RepID=UPI001E49D279|nr:hypothetical protein [Fischerella sp. PCC 9605]
MRSCQRRYPSEGGIVERPFGTFNTELLSTLPGYTGSNVKRRPKGAEKEASLTLEQLERLIVRYIVERYNQSLDPRTGSLSSPRTVGSRTNCTITAFKRSRIGYLFNATLKAGGISRWIHSVCQPDV